MPRKPKFAISLISSYINFQFPTADKLWGILCTKNRLQFLSGVGTVIFDLGSSQENQFSAEAAGVVVKRST